MVLMLPMWSMPLKLQVPVQVQALGPAVAVNHTVQKCVEQLAQLIAPVTFHATPHRIPGSKF